MPTKKKKDYIHTTWDGWLKRDTLKNADKFFLSIRKTGGAWRLFIDRGTSSHLYLRSEFGYATIERALKIAREFKKHVPNTIIYLIKHE